MRAPHDFETHEVLNQSPPFVDVDLYSADLPLREALRVNGGGGDEPSLSAFGRRWGSAEIADAARLANENTPKLKAFDAKGFRRDTIEFHPAYHGLMSESMEAGLHASTWRADGTHASPPSEVERGARFYMAAQVETGHLCPVTMTRAAVGALSADAALSEKLLPKILARDYDPAFRPWEEKPAITIGMGMTEKQGGTDVRANSTRALSSGDSYLLTGHKWFMSAPMCDAFLVLAQAPGGLTCFFLPRFRPDGGINALRFQRLKDKLGNRSNASSEVEFVQAFALRLGEEGRGVRTIIEMVQLTRLDCALASTGLMRMALAQAMQHARHRTVFQRKLADQPMMRGVLADLALEVEAAVALVMRLCRAFDHAATDPAEAAFARLLTPAVKYWICKSAPSFIYEAMECLGGNGYVEESVLPRLYREAPVNAIWEGSGNVMCLDVLRALAREPDETRAAFKGLMQEGAASPALHQHATELIANVQRGADEPHARLMVENLAKVAAAAALAKCAPSAVADAFIATRLGNRHARMFGAVELPLEATQLLHDRALPA
jgi:putative acyl-CoA dehydrogenase